MDKHSLKIKIAVLAYFEKDGKVLLQKRKNTGWRDGWDGVVAGHVDCDRQFFYFIVKKWKGTPTNTEPEKCDGIEWFDKNSLPENLIPVVKYGMDKMLTGEKYSEFGWEEGYTERS